MKTSNPFTVTVTALLIPALLVTEVMAFWRMPCERSGLARIDPLISPGEISAHSHTIHGSSGFSETSEWSDLRAGDCTSCQVAEDKSAYWTPPPMFKNAATGEFTIVEQVGGMLAYYLLYPNAGNTSLSAFPEGFKMIAGNNAQRNFTLPVPDPPKSNWAELGQDTQVDLEAKALGFNCLNYNNASATEGSLYRHFLPSKAFIDEYCPDGIRMELMFPSCWDGVNVYTEDNSHVAYPNLVMTGDCPSGYPIRLPSLFYETIWDVAAFPDVDGEFVIANGDPTGYGYHGDFIMGWDPAFLQQAVDTCTNPSGEIQDCPLFTIQDASVYNSCNISMPSAIVSEDVVGPMSELPGAVAIQSGPALAIEGLTVGATGAVPSATASATYVVPTLPVSAGSTIYASASETYALGGVFDQIASGNTETKTSTTISTTISTSVVASSSSTVTSAPSLSSAVSSAAAESFASTEWTTSGRAAIEIFWVEETVTVTAPGATATLAAREAETTPEAHDNFLVARHLNHAAKHLRNRHGRMH